MSLDLDKSTWKRVAFGDVAKASKESCDPAYSNVDRYIAGEHMYTDELKIRRWGIVGDGYLGPAFHRRFRAGQVLYGSRRTYLRKVAVAEFDGVCANTTFVVDTSDKKVLLQEFLPFIMTSQRFHAFAIAESKGSVNPYVNWSDIARHEVDLPPLDEQQRIADLLWALELHKRQLADAALHQAERLRLAQLIDNSTGPLARISSVGSVLMGRQRSPQHATGQHMVPYLRVANVGDDLLKLDDIKQMNFTPDEQRRYSVRPGDILVSEGQSRELVGQSVLITQLPEPMCYQNTLIRFRANPDLIRPAYAQALFRACLHSGIFADIATQTTSIAHLGVQRFANLELPIPSISEQDRTLVEIGDFSAAFTAVDAECTALNALSARLSVEIFGDSE